MVSFVHVVESTYVGADVASVWQVVGDPGAIADWMPGIVSTSVAGDLRTSVLAAGHDTVLERIIDLDPAARSMTLEYLAGPWAGHFLSSQLTVEESGTGSRVHWHADFSAPDREAEAATQARIAAVYRPALENLARLVVAS